MALRPLPSGGASYADHTVVIKAKSIPLTILLISVLWSGAAWGSTSTIDARLIRDVVCDGETQGLSQPQWRLGVDPLDWGVCQVRYESAWRYTSFDLSMKRRGVPSRCPCDLFIEEVSRSVALDMIDLCMTFYPHGDAQRIAYCYSAGLWSKPGSNQRKWKVAGERAAEYDRRNQLRLARR